MDKVKSWRNLCIEIAEKVPEIENLSLDDLNALLDYSKRGVTIP
jgi:hypothetical protein